MYKKKKKYELEVHFGLLVLVIIMLCLNIVSNYVISNVRNLQKKKMHSELNITSLAISRYMRNNQLFSITEKLNLEFCTKYNVDEIIIVPSLNNYSNNSEKLILLHKEFKSFSQEKRLQLSKIILTTELNSLARSDENQYAFVSALSLREQQTILVLLKTNDILTYLNDASSMLVKISLITIFAIILIYLLLYRFILSPFKKIKEDAVLAGRPLPTGNYEVDSVVDDYQTIIHELQDKEAELVILHKKATQRADSFEQFNQHLLESMQSGLITIDKDGNVLTINKAVENICQINADLYVGENYNIIPFLNNNLIENIEKTLSSKHHHPYEEYELENPTQKIGLIISPICDNETHQIGASIIVNDISEIKKLQNEVEKNRQMSALGEMSAGLAHQLRNSLGAIVGYNQLVKKRLVQNNIETSVVDSMATELKESEHLIQRFLNFTKPFNYLPEKEIISDFIEDIIDTLMVRNDFSLTQIQFTNNLLFSIEIPIDRLLLKQAITNLIENSKNAYETKKNKIDILLTTESDNCVIQIQDYASGIELKNLEKIFTPFYSTNPSGTGLGLPLAQKIIALHNGNLQVESTVGVGTIFKILLPIEKTSSPTNLSLKIK